MNCYFLFKTVSNSMYPLIKINDIILIKKIEYNLLNVNDIIAFKNESKTFVHRIIKRSKFKGITKGDNNKRIDVEFLTIKNFIGKAFYILRDYKIINIYDGSEYNLCKMENNCYYCCIGNEKLTFNQLLTSCEIEYR